ncbi:hypothetical protein IW140_003575 [Coemansia sp. RSA 1813]|nr:hypothetical protein EV178_003457 [Coemansia sp. RSA 1646]KAJ1769313.1 hypothetical protein LPJ74_004140 [Coemansia sp. RSA 1843]KAJ2089116.1 hypothetical protein IW138_003696 [Coemansia sp. RSA 986]KAJ2215627.1 hypothetical protein EV179_002038 [Coemansia sp. RSA 487]KAJ2568818.1 hypothetical protein IW140_003575 [Coemansia sp. RSA 1813]
MDGFIDTLKPQTIYLDGYDDGSSFLNIAFYFWYEKTVPSNVLEAALYRTLEEFPILAGRIKTGNDSRSFVVIDKHRLNMPVYTDSSCNVHFQTLKDSGFDVSLLPADYSSACKSPAPPGIIGHCMRLAEFHVLRMKDDSGMCIFSSVSHAILDGKAYCMFMKRWADISKRIMAVQEQQDICDIVVPAEDFQHDRSILETDKNSGTDALEPELYGIITKNTVAARWIAWFSPEVRGRIFRYLMSSSNICNYYFPLSSSAFEHLVQLVRQFAEPDISHLSANDVISALATVLFAQALHRAGRLDGEVVYLATIVADIRPRVKQLANTNYVGNTVLPKTAACLLDRILKDCGPQVLAAVACNIRRAVDGLDERYCNQLGHLINKYPCGYVDLVMNITSMENAFVSTNHTRFEYYASDFGSGSPVLVRPAFLIFENDFVIMPGHPSVGGYELAFTMVPEIAKYMMESEYWQYIH